MKVEDGTVAPDPAPSAPPTTVEVSAYLLRKREAGAERVRKHRAKKAGSAASESPDTPPELTATDFSVAGDSFAFVWGVVAVPLARGRLRPMDPAQTREAGKVFAPLIRKYLPLLADWQLEIMAGMFLVSLVSECAIKPPLEPAVESEGVNGEAQA